MQSTFIEVFLIKWENIRAFIHAYEILRRPNNANTDTPTFGLSSLIFRQAGPQRR